MTNNRRLHFFIYVLGPFMQNSKIPLYHLSSIAVMALCLIYIRNKVHLDIINNTALLSYLNNDINLDIFEAFPGHPIDNSQSLNTCVRNIVPTGVSTNAFHTN